jgi:hypothetical protein
MSTITSKLVLGAAVATVVAGGAPLALAASTTTLKTTMTGKAEAPTRGDADGSGKATIRITGKKVCFIVSYSRIGKPSDAHIHKGAKGKAGPVVVGLFAGGFKKSGCVTTTSAIAKAIARHPSSYYVNLHNKAFPNGAVRGQL